MKTYASLFAIPASLYARAAESLDAQKRNDNPGSYDRPSSRVCNHLQREGAENSYALMESEDLSAWTRWGNRHPDINEDYDPRILWLLFMSHVVADERREESKIKTRRAICKKCAVAEPAIQTAKESHALRALLTKARALSTSVVVTNSLLKAEAGWRFQRRNEKITEKTEWIDSDGKLGFSNVVEHYPRHLGWWVRDVCARDVVCRVPVEPKAKKSRRAKETKAAKAWRLAVAEAGPVPNSFIVGAAEAVIGGDVARLGGFCTWSDSMQGYKFWSQQYNAKRLSAKGRRIINTWIKIMESKK